MTVHITTGLDSASGIFAVLIVAILTLLTLGFAARSITSINVRPALAVGFLASFFVLAFLISFDNVLVKDALVWHTRSLTVTSFLNGTSNTPVADFGGKDGYVWIVGTIYALVGVVPLVPIALNFLLQGLTVITVARTTEIVAETFPGLDKSGRGRAVTAAAFFVAIGPSLLPWVPQLLREILSCFLISLAILMCVQFIRSRRSGYLISGAVALAVLFSVRDSIGLGVSMALVAALTFTSLQTSKYKVAMRIFLFGPFLAAGAVFWSFANERFGLSAEDIALHSKSLSSGATSGFSDGTQFNAQSSYFDILSLNVPRVLAGPFPWEIRPTGVMLFAALEGAIWLGTIFFAIHARPSRHVRKDKSQPNAMVNSSFVIILLATTFALLAMIAVSTGNYGILSRLRLMPLVALAPLACIGYAKWRTKGSQQNTTRYSLNADAIV